MARTKQTARRTVNAHPLCRRDVSKPLACAPMRRPLPKSPDRKEKKYEPEFEAGALLMHTGDLKQSAAAVQQQEQVLPAAAQDEDASAAIGQDDKPQPRTRSSKNKKRAAAAPHASRIEELEAEVADLKAQLAEKAQRIAELEAKEQVLPAAAQDEDASAAIGQDEPQTRTRSSKNKKRDARPQPRVGSSKNKKHAAQPTSRIEELEAENAELKAQLGEKDRRIAGLRSHLGWYGGHCVNPRHALTEP